MNFKILLIGLTTFVSGITGETVVNAQDTLLQHYIEQGLQNNLKLQRKESNYKISIQQLRQAKGQFYPELKANARYTRAHGGRTINFPIGDLLNPVYKTLNDYMGQQKFPLTSNKEFHFRRDKEQYTRLKFIQPLFNSDIYFNKQLKETNTAIKQADALAYQRQLVAEIKKAYFNFVMTQEIIHVLKETQNLLQRNVKLTKSLYRQDKVTKDKIYRSQSEVSKIRKTIAETQGQLERAQSYFNFLLNRDLKDSIKIDSSYQTLRELPLMSIEKARKNALNKREELSLLDKNIERSQTYLQMQKANKLPTLSLTADYGFQGRHYSFTFDDDFVVASLVLQWDLFKGFRTNAGIQEAKIQHEKAIDRKKETQQNIRLEVINAYNDLKTAQKEIIAARNEKKSTQKAFAIVSKKYRTGEATLIEYIDARTTMTKSKQKLIRANYMFYSKYAEFERAAALYPLSKYSNHNK